MHTIDTRVKVLPIILLLTLLLISDSMIFYLTMVIFLIVLLINSGVTKEIAKENLKPIFYFILFTSAYHILFSGRDTEVLFSIGNISLYQGAVLDALYYSLRLILFLSAAFFITLTSSPSELAEAITKLLRPLKVFKFRLSDFSLILFISIRFIPILYEEFNNVRNAQKIRGVNFSGSMVTKILNLKSLLIPMFLSALRRADALSDALMVRGYSSTKDRTFYSTHKLTIRDMSFLIVALSIITLPFYYLG